jgi:hypothetical protein
MDLIVAIQIVMDTVHATQMENAFVGGVGIPIQI